MISTKNKKKKKIRAEGEICRSNFFEFLVLSKVKNRRKLEPKKESKQINTEG
jgi:hypothetical protein